MWCQLLRSLALSILIMTYNDPYKITMGLHFYVNDLASFLFLDSRTAPHLPPMLKSGELWEPCTFPGLIHALPNAPRGWKTSRVSLVLYPKIPQLYQKLAQYTFRWMKQKIRHGAGEMRHPTSRREDSWSKARRRKFRWDSPFFGGGVDGSRSAVVQFLPYLPAFYISTRP